MNYSSTHAIKADMVGTQVVVCTDDGHVVTWGANDIRIDSEVQYRRTHKSVLSTSKQGSVAGSKQESKAASRKASRRPSINNILVMKKHVGKDDGDDYDDDVDPDEPTASQKGFKKMSKLQVMSGISTPGLGSPLVSVFPRPVSFSLFLTFIARPPSTDNYVSTNCSAGRKTSPRARKKC